MLLVGLCRKSVRGKPSSNDVLKLLTYTIHGPANAFKVSRHVSQSIQPTFILMLHQSDDSMRKMEEGFFCSTAVQS